MSAEPLGNGDRVGLFEAKTHFSELVARAEAGEEITITRHGRPVARLAPPIRQQGATEVTARASKIHALLKAEGFSTTPSEIQELKAFGRL